MRPTLQTSLEISRSEDIQISLFKNCTSKESTQISLKQLFERIQSDKELKEKITHIRTTADKKEIDSLKKSLQAVTISGTFNGGHNLESLKSHSGLIQIDIDKPENILALKEKLKEDKFSLAVFDSPTLTGIKVIVKIEASNHSESFKSLYSYYKTNFDVTIDEKCKDISRLMFLCSDEKIFINYNSETWINPINEKQCFLNMVKWVEQTKKIQFTEGERNRYMLLLSSACFRIGISEAYTLNECLEYTQETFTSNEITSIVKKAYKGNKPNPNSKEIPQKVVKAKDENYTQIAKVENFINSHYELRLNEVSLTIEYRNINSEDPFQILNDNTLYCELQRVGISYSASRLNSLLASDFVETYNPFKNYFEQLKNWDESVEVDYILKLSEYLPIQDKERFAIQFKKMFVRCVACALDDTVFNKQAFVFVHAEQNSGKSTFCRWLCPPALSSYIAENISIDKDGLIALCENFLINLDELATLSKAEINMLKSFFSLADVKVRAPFAKKAEKKPRRANFIGSTNKDEFLSDETGSIRFICFELTDRINFAYKTEMDINDIWRQAYSLYKSGFQFQLTLQEISENEKANQQYQIRSIEFELIQKKYKKANKDEIGAMFLTATDILNDISFLSPYSKLNANAIGKALRLLGFQKSDEYISDKGYSVKGYYLVKM